MQSEVKVIIVCGEALIDCVPADCGGRTGLLPKVGGSPYNVACGLARLAVPVGYLGRISADPFGTLLLDRLADDGVDLTSTTRTPAPSPLAIVHLDTDGIARYSFHLEGSATAELAVDDLPDPLDPTVRAVHTGSLALLLEPGRRAVATLLERAHAAGALTSLDPNVRPSCIPNREAYLEELDGWLARTDLVKVSDEDLAWLYPDRAPLDVLGSWLERGPSLAVLTQGADGAAALSAGGQFADVPGVNVSVVDTIGAGDSFTAGLLAWLSDTQALTREQVARLGTGELTEALRFAGAAAAVTCTREGADPPRRDEL